MPGRWFMKHVFIRIVKPEIGNWEVGQELTMAEHIATELVKDGTAIVIPKLSPEKPKERKTLQQVMEQVAEKNSQKIGAA